MELFHFTDIANKDNILKKGIRTSSDFVDIVDNFRKYNI